jgi:hypothetical protein
MLLPKPAVFPTRVVYQLFIIFAVIIVVPFIWFGMKYVVDAVITFATSNYPDDFTGARSQVTSLHNAIWTYMPIIALLPVIVWAIMATMKERKYQAW